MCNQQGWHVADIFRSIIEYRQYSMDIDSMSRGGSDGE
jgi:hypothetical protein